MRCRFVVHNNEVIAISSCNGKPIKAVAKCHPEDTFDVEKGKAIASSKLDIKILEKRLTHGIKKLESSRIKMMIAIGDADAAAEYVNRITNELVDAEIRLATILNPNLDIK